MARSLYSYTPSAAAAIIFLILFGVVTVLHIYYVIQRRTWYFLVLVVGGILEAVGYVGRFLSSSNTEDLAPFLIQNLFLLVAPSLFAASIYMVLGRIIVSLEAEKLSPIRTSWLTKIFVGGDVLSFFVQIVGAGMLSKPDTFDLGKTIILVGLALQIIFFGLFVIVAASFHVRLNRHSSRPLSRLADIGKREQFLVILWVLYGVSVLIFVRSIIRLVEYTDGGNGPLMSNEVFLYLFDSVPMWAVLALLIYYHPSNYVRGKKGVVVPGKNKHHGHTLVGFGSN
ncbi:RTA-like protein [Xylaria curta]|nr:RTA-like protein [Xylaria curta]